ncbi:hypothetical protein PCANC_26121 [Puccinia coronata f. sp. avenae]|uniref:Uncharacterized protein n=1 Tax=Puccinia coronata f. sp. avenae TaxID=200324 RepID=A0A2N5U2U1_9BASI|nr:hypothetical protein PCANC_26121 [Puccinia coronata f. sp. avenae]PLW32032.1 hypothetical protein PCASD_22166 [Puccinia coronata f. sp. avenae]
MDDISRWETGDHVLKGLGLNPAEDALAGLNQDLLGNQDNDSLGNWPYNEFGWHHVEVGGLGISNLSQLQYYQTLSTLHSYQTQDSEITDIPHPAAMVERSRFKTADLEVFNPVDDLLPIQACKFFEKKKKESTQWQQNSGINYGVE